jgi:hypothetical protein
MLPRAGGKERNRRIGSWAVGLAVAWPLFFEKLFFKFTGFGSIALVAVSVSIASVFAFAYVGVFSVVFVGVFCVVFVLVVSIVGAVVAPVVGSLAFGAFSVFIVALSLSCTAAVGRAYDRIVRRASAGTNRRGLPALRQSAIPIFAAVGFLVLAALTPTWLPHHGRSVMGTFNADGAFFGVLFFTVFLPVLNGLFDYFSVGITQIFLARVRDGGNPLIWFAADLLAALALVAGLYVVVYFTLFGMEAAGWAISAKKVFSDFMSSPASSLWLVFLAITNVLPTLLHLAFSITGIYEERFGGDAAHARSLAWEWQSRGKLVRPDAVTLAKYLGYKKFVPAIAWMICLTVWASWLAHLAVPFAVKSLLS